MASLGDVFRVLNDLKSEGVIEYETVPVRVAPPEHLIALASQAGGGRRRERAYQLLETAKIDHEALDKLLNRYGIEAPWSGHE